MGTKICSKCGEDKEIDKFGIRRVERDGLQDTCKECFNKKRRERYSINADQMRAYARDRLQTDNYKITRKLYIDRNKNKISNSNKKYRESNIDKILPREREYNKINAKEKSIKNTARKLGISPQDCKEIIIVNNNRCCICGKDQSEISGRLRIDHDHITGKVRGCLCHSCNCAIGLFKDDISILKSAVEYLEKHS
jgi:hypothetical protein